MLDSTHVTLAILESGGRKAIEKAIAEYHKNTCIRFIKKTTETAYLSFYKGGG